MKTYQLAMHSVLRLDDGRSTLITSRFLCNEHYASGHFRMS